MVATLFDRLAALRVEIEDASLEGRSLETSYGFERPTTLVVLSGGGAVGIGEDVTTDVDDQARLQANGLPNLAGSYSLAGLLERVDELPFTADGGEQTDTDWNRPGQARRWAIESAALDLGLRQARRTLGDQLDRRYDPVSYLVSLRLQEPTVEPIEAWRAIDPTLEFKLDVTGGWTGEFIDVLSAVDGVRILDFKRGEEAMGAALTDPDRYARIVDRFPDVVFEDPRWEPPFAEAFADVRDQISWDGTIDSLAAVEALPFEPRWLNIKPARFGSLRTLFEVLEWASSNGVSLYGGGMFELDRGRSHLHALASLFYPDGPNDIAPVAYHVPEPVETGRSSPLAPPEQPGIGFQA